MWHPGNDGAKLLEAVLQTGCRGSQTTAEFHNGEVDHAARGRRVHNEAVLWQPAV
jgi:hypothetical protein